MSYKFFLFIGMLYNQGYSPGKSKRNLHLKLQFAKLQFGWALENKEKLHDSSRSNKPVPKCNFGNCVFSTGLFSSNAFTGTVVLCTRCAQG